MADYASVPDWENKRETRKIRLLLEALEENGSVVSGASSDLYVEQYNALIVTLEDDSDGYRGFSRFDFGDETKRGYRGISWLPDRHSDGDIGALLL